MDVYSATQALGSYYINKVTNAVKSASSNQVSTDSDTFDSVYNSVVGLLNDTNKYIQDASQAEIDFSLGNLTSTHELSVYQQKANLALQYTVAIRDKALEAYKEIMNMSM
ncbi:MAG: flagellar hook-basal body complex protein FliE [Clostridia bacterium]|nr:flagellar hook-basal body complex protein FliE [[Bacteroides] pectinophilus]MDD5872659.1 flagellar hook-basal body complex protein FliE [Clostridia bacterium]